jgi:guanylate kinase
MFLNFAGLRVRTSKNIQDIQDAVEPRMRAVGKRMQAVINYDNFVIHEDVMDEYADLVLNGRNESRLSIPIISHTVSVYGGASVTSL